MGDPQNGWFISWKIQLKWMIWGYPYFRKPPYIYIYVYHIALNRQLYAPKCESLSQPVQLCSLGVRENEAVQLG